MKPNPRPPPPHWLEVLVVIVILGALCVFIVLGGCTIVRGPCTITKEVKCESGGRVTHPVQP